MHLFYLSFSLKGHFAYITINIYFRFIGILLSVSTTEILERTLNLKVAMKILKLVPAIHNSRT